MNVFLTIVAASCGWALFLYATSKAAKANAKGALSWLRAAWWGILAMLGLGLGLAPMTARAEIIEAPVVVQARHPSGITIQLHEIAGPCMSGARLATFVPASGKDRVQGCFKVSDAGVVNVVWFDTDMTSIPARAFKRPDEV